MAINILYTDANGNNHVERDYQCEHASFIYSSDMAKEAAQIRRVNPITGDSTIEVLDTDTGYIFEEHYLYFVQITDLQNNIIVEWARIYQIGHGAHENVFGICESSKCKVPVVSEKYYGFQKIAEITVNATPTYSNPKIFNYEMEDLASYDCIAAHAEGTIGVNSYLNIGGHKYESSSSATKAINNIGLNYICDIDKLNDSIRVIDCRSGSNSVGMQDFKIECRNSGSGKASTATDVKVILYGKKRDKSLIEIINNA